MVDTLRQTEEQVSIVRLLFFNSYPCATAVSKSFFRSKKSAGITDALKKDAPRWVLI